MTLATMERTRLEGRRFRLEATPGMRTSERNLMTLLAAQENDAPGWMNPAVILAETDGTRTRQGQVITGHDDWDCLRDLARAGFLTIDETAFTHGADVTFSPKGQILVEALREHKRIGGGFSDFRIEDVPWAEKRKRTP